MAGGYEVDAELARGVQARLLRLPGEEGVVARVRRLDQVVARRAGRDRDPLDPLRAMREDRRVALHGAQDPLLEVLDAARLGEAAGKTDLAELTLTLDAERGR